MPIRATPMTEHTPGPWTVGTVSSRYVIAGSGFYVARATGRGKEQDYANARFIASAPDTLEQRDELLKAAIQGVREHRDCVMPSTCWCRDAEAAIAKAEAK